MRTSFKDHIKKVGLTLVLDEVKVRMPSDSAFMKLLGDVYSYYSLRSGGGLQTAERNNELMDE